MLGYKKKNEQNERLPNEAVVTLDHLHCTLHTVFLNKRARTASREVSDDLDTVNGAVLHYYSLTQVPGQY